MPQHYRADKTTASRIDRLLGTGLARKAAKSMKKRKKKLDSAIKRQSGK